MPATDSAPLQVLPETESDQPRAEAMAARLGCPCLPVFDSGVRYPEQVLLLRVADQGLSLQPGGPRPPGPVAVDFTDAAMRHRRKGGQNELLGRAVGWRADKAPTVLDTTAGLGRDSFVLADLGCRVTLCERHPVLAAMLEQGIEQAAEASDRWIAEAAERMTLWPDDARERPLPGSDQFDVIYLDPMFPPRGKRALVKKELATLQQLLGSEAASDADALLLWALEQPVKRVVVKRPPRADFLGQRRPSHQITGKAVRFDVYMLT